MDGVEKLVELNTSPETHTTPETDTNPKTDDSPEIIIIIKNGRQCKAERE